MYKRGNRMTKSGGFFISRGFILGVGWACLACAQEKIDFSPMHDETRVLKNPHKGWYQHYYDNGTSKYAIRDEALFARMEGMDHLYVRLAWSYLEPEEGRFDWSKIDALVEKYVPLGYGLSFRITCDETGTAPNSVGQCKGDVHYAVPTWVEAAGAKGRVIRHATYGCWVPEYDDPVFLSKLDRFHAAFAARYGKQPYVRYVDVGSIGDWGEGHTSFSTKEEVPVETIRKHLALYSKHYWPVQLIVADDLLYYKRTLETYLPLYREAVLKGFSLRDDSPMVTWYVKAYEKSYSVSHPQFYTPLYETAPIVFELEHYATVKAAGNWVGPNGSGMMPNAVCTSAAWLERAIEILHATYIGYHGWAEEWYRDNPELHRRLANRCGYWYFPLEAEHAALASVSNTLTVAWLNKGVAPAYVDYALALRLTDSTGRHYTVPLIPAQNRAWMPGKMWKGTYRWSWPKDAPVGAYAVSFKLVESSANGLRTIALGVKKTVEDADGYLALGRIEKKSE